MRGIWTIEAAIGPVLALTRFDSRTGSGKRNGQRPCALSFSKT
jgi:hypothetical protein